MVVNWNDKEWLLKRKKKNGCKSKRTRKAVEVKEKEWLSTGMKKNGC